MGDGLEEFRRIFHADSLGWEKKFTADKNSPRHKVQTIKYNSWDKASNRFHAKETWKLSQRNSADREK